MTRKPNETVGQRELALRYRILLDEAMRVPPDGRRIARREKARRRILELALENPQSTMSNHVMWNIGKARREWLIAFLDKEKPGWFTPRKVDTFTLQK